MSSRGTPTGRVPRDPQSQRRRSLVASRNAPRNDGPPCPSLPPPLLAACSGNPKPKDYAFPPAEKPAVGTVVEGVASWYGPGYDGKKTSSGEVFDQDALTAAHAYWAFGTRVKVTFPTTGKSVVVRINDRFPSHKGRAIDLSRGAAKAIGLIGPGTGQVRLEVVE